MTKFRLQTIKDDTAWDNLVQASPQGTIFSLSLYLYLAVDYHQRYFILKGNQIKAGLSFVLNPEKDACILDDLIIYNGLMFVDDISKKEAKARLERFEITEFVVNWLSESYARIELALAPQFEDIRPFLWHNYHSGNLKDKFETDLRYTSYVDISSLKSIEGEESTVLYKDLETLRQRNIREARRDGATYKTDNDPTLFIEHYQELLRHKGGNQSPGKLERMKRLIGGLINCSLAVMIISLNGKNQPIYSTIYCWDKKRAYYLFGAPVPGITNRYKGTISFWDGFRHLATQDITQIDMEGVNSPNRGWFKLSFGGSLQPYYQVYK